MNTLHEHFAWICWIPVEEYFGISNSILVGGLILLNKLWVAHIARWIGVEFFVACQYLFLECSCCKAEAVYNLYSPTHCYTCFSPIWLMKDRNVKNYGTLGQHWRGNLGLVPLRTVSNLCILLGLTDDVMVSKKFTSNLYCVIHHVMLSLHWYFHRIVRQRSYSWLRSNYMEEVDVKRRSISLWLNCEAIR